ncbi:hypothetical protein [Methanoculleus nereidis]|jgi:hypothetical protein|nr:hypothetical protein [Methanoculleus sp. YWC-01]
MPDQDEPWDGILWFYGTIRRKRLPAGPAASGEAVKVFFAGRS